ncbi:MAG: MauE/DoxX family redox-associated membrane protein [Desulfopila sp.]
MYSNQLGKPATARDAVRDRRRLWLFHSCRVFLGVVFVYASYDKILHPQAFALAVYNYQIVPDPFINLVALILPWLELLLGLCLLAGVWLPGATVVGSGLMLVFIGALFFNQIRGLDIHCGCFSTEVTEGSAGLGTVLRDLGFFAVSLYLLVYVFLGKRSR